MLLLLLFDISVSLFIIYRLIIQVLSCISFLLDLSREEELSSEIKFHSQSIIPASDTYQNKMI